MIDENLFLIIIFLIILVIFYFLNIILKKNIEKYGIYCGRYNLDKPTAEKFCKGDNECLWNNYKARDGTPAGWCGQNPSTLGNGVLAPTDVVPKNEVVDFYKSVFNGSIFKEN